MTQCTRTFLEITCCIDCSLVFQKEKLNQNCIDAVYSRTCCSLILATIMWLVLCALTIIKHDLFHAKLKAMILTYNCLENLANRKQYVRKNGTNLTLLSVTQWVPRKRILRFLLFLTFINHLPSAIVDIFADNTTFSSSVNFSLGTLTLQSPFNRTSTVHVKSYWKLKSS